MTKSKPILLLKSDVEVHNKDQCALCQQREPFDENAIRHVLEHYVAQGKLVKVLHEDGSIGWQEPGPFYKQNPQFAVKSKMRKP